MAVLSKSAVEAFLYNRELSDSGVAKAFTEAAIDAKLEASGAVFTTQPHLHQKVTFLLGLKYPNYLIILDPGLGKSKVALDLFVHRKVRQRARRAIVLVPNTTNLMQWIQQIKTHTPSLTAAVVNGQGRDAREAQMYSQADVVICTYLGFLSFVCKGKVVDANDKGEAITKGWTLDEKRFKEFVKEFDFGIFDETTAFKNSQSLLYRTVRKLGQRLLYCYGLTGTPHGRKVEDLWAQFNVIDGGETLGETLGLFRAAFFNEVRGYGGFPEYKFDVRKMDDLQRVIRHRSIRYRDTECLDLPAQTRVVQSIIFSDETWRYYLKLLDDLKDARGNFQLLDNVFIRMRMLCSGYLAVKDPEGERIEVRFKNNPKLEALLEWLGEIPEDRKVVIFHEFITSGDIICEALKQAKYKFSRLWSGQKGKDEQVRRFLEDPTYRIIVSSSSGALGGNWQVANYMGFFESPVDPITREQEERRIYRIGQERRVFYTDFTVVNSVEEKILRYVKEGKDLRKQLIDNLLTI